MLTWPEVLSRRAARPATPSGPLPVRVLRSSVARVRATDRSTIGKVLECLVEGPSYRSTSSWFSAWSAYSALSFASVGSFSSAFSFGSIGSSGSLWSIGSTGSILSIGSAGSVLSIGSTGSILSIGRASQVLANARDEAEGGTASVAPARVVERGATILGTCALVVGAVSR